MYFEDDSYCWNWIIHKIELIILSYLYKFDYTQIELFDYCCFSNKNISNQTNICKNTYNPYKSIRFYSRSRNLDATCSDCGSASPLPASAFFLPFSFRTRPFFFSLMFSSSSSHAFCRHKYFLCSKYYCSQLIDVLYQINIRVKNSETPQHNTQL